MKKTITLLILVIILVILVFLGFSFITQNGLFAKEAYFINSADNFVLRETQYSTVTPITGALKTREKNSDIPNNGTYTGTIIVSFWPDITMSYKVAYNPYTGEGFIEKGLLKKNFYKIPDDTLNALIKVEKSEITDGHLTVANPLDIPILTIINSGIATNLNPVDSGGENLLTHKLTETLATGEEVQANLTGDPNTLKVFYQKDTMFYELPEKYALQLFSEFPFYEDYKASLPKTPVIGLMTHEIIEPSLYVTDWTKIKPNGDPSSHEHTDILESAQELTPGTKLTFYHNGFITPDQFQLEEYQNDVLINVYTDLATPVTVPYFEGHLSYVLSVVYSADSSPKSYGSINAEYSYELEFPTESVNLYDQVRPGDILSFAVRFPDEGEKYTIESSLKNFKADFTPYGNSLMALVPVNWWTSPGEYTADIYVESDGVKTIFKEYTVTVLPDNFVTEYQYLEVSDELKEKTDPAKTINDGVIVAEAKSNPNPTSYLKGTFIMPINGELGTSYAMTRYINGTNPYRHSGLDIDGEMSDPIVAGNNGVIVYAGPLVRPGNTVIIDHGMGLYSSYLHMSGFAVEAGDYVEKGEVVGYIGSTGFSTGPHLHWSVTMNGNYLSPLWLIENPLVPE